MLLTAFVAVLLKSHSTSVVLKSGPENKPPMLLRERLKEHPQLSALLRSDISKYGVLTALAEESLHSKDFDNAEQLATKAIRTAERTHQENNVYAAFAKGILASAYHGEKRYKEAADEYRDALKAYEQHYSGKTSPDTIELAGATQLLTYTFLRNCEFKEAVEADSLALRLSAELYGASSHEVAGALANLGTALMETGDLSKEVEQLLLRAQGLYEAESSASIMARAATRMSGSVSTTDVSLEYVHTTCILGMFYLLRGDTDLAEQQLALAAVSGGFATLAEATAFDVKNFLMY